MTRLTQPRQHGFSAAELLVALAIGGIVIGTAAVAFGTIMRAQPRVGSSAYVTIDSARISNLGFTGTSIPTSIAPNYGALAQAEDLRESFLADTLSATAVFCLGRTDVNTYRPLTIPYNPTNIPAATDPVAPLKAIPDAVLDTNAAFRQHLYDKGLITSSLYTTTVAKRNVDTAATSATIFVLGYSTTASLLKVAAIYEIDIVKTTVAPAGFYANVRRYASNTAAIAMERKQYYDVFYPTTTPTTWPTTTDAFTPLWAAFERYNRRDKPEGADIDRFKAAHEKPFYFIWWPDPAAKNLGLNRASTSTFVPTDPRKTYNQMAGRTSFMFTVPMFPAL